ncbi:hypothetical protein HanXRQr2_Chr07g0308311 [Helianthus annuus]|uniref:Uncharacterized protein n=1 Tax=Helianthus annuus TaxID=4232 RepID=A0A251TC10_HELAN|nr:hypothetical protein HanXRQr2_Chr07g0308311 [Helianthus annuus]
MKKFTIFIIFSFMIKSLLPAPHPHRRPRNTTPAPVTPLVFSGDPPPSPATRPAEPA